MVAEQWAEVEIARGQVHTFLREVEPARHAFQEALAVLDLLPESPTVRQRKAKACRGMGELFDREDPQEALEWLERGLQVLGDASPREAAALRIVAGSIQMGLGEYAAAQASVEQGLEMLPPGHEHLRIMALIGLGTIHSVQGEMEQGSAHTEQALALSRLVGDRFKMLTALSNLGTDKYFAGDWTGAARDLGQAQEMALELGNVEEQIRLQNNLGTLQTHLGEHDAALRTLEQSIEAARRHHVSYELVFALHSLAELNIQMEAWDAAHDAAGEAEQRALELGIKPILPQIYASLAQIQLATGGAETPIGYAQQAVDLARELEAAVEEGIALRALGQALLASDQPGEAQMAFEQSLGLLAEDAPFEAARTQVQWGLALLESGETQEGQRSLQEARAILSALGARHDLAAVDEVLEHDL
jgi:tetratricopeptide (TPR) repeat protein